VNLLLCAVHFVRIWQARGMFHPQPSMMEGGDWNGHSY
jgi:hypothetical protein